VKSKVEVTQFVRRFMSDTADSADGDKSKSNKDITVWDPNFDERVSEWYSNLVKAGLGN